MFCPHIARFYLQQKVNSLFSFQRQPPYALLLLNKFILSPEPLAESLLHLIVDVGSDAFLHLFVYIHHGGTFVEDAKHLKHSTRDEAHGRDGVDDAGIDQDAIEGGSPLIRHHMSLSLKM